MKLEQGIFTISLDFELFWGMRDKLKIEEYEQNLLGVQTVVPKLLDAFEKYKIHATWATVGFLFFENKEHLSCHFPAYLPNYSKKKLSPYQYILSADELDKKYHFAPELIALIRQKNGQEIGTHTFSHYYCLEEGQTKQTFASDLLKAIEVAQENGLEIKSLVFPRNQWNQTYLQTLQQLGLICYRGNELGWLYSATSGRAHKLKRGLRLIDAYISLSGYHTYHVERCINDGLINLPASRFLRPYTKKLAFLDGLRLNRIIKAMDDAAQNNKIYHLWWHPHNFGTNIAQNMGFLTKILEHFKLLEAKWGMTSLNMGELGALIGAEYAK